jgi:hypothetical protein
MNGHLSATQCSLLFVPHQQVRICKKIASEISVNSIVSGAAARIEICYRADLSDILFGSKAPS